MDALRIERMYDCASDFIAETKQMLDQISITPGQLDQYLGVVGCSIYLHPRVKNARTRVTRSAVINHINAGRCLYI